MKHGKKSNKHIKDHIKKLAGSLNVLKFSDTLLSFLKLFLKEQLSVNWRCKNDFEAKPFLLILNVYKAICREFSQLVKLGFKVVTWYLYC